MIWLVCTTAGVVEALAVHLHHLDTVVVVVYRTPESATSDRKSGHIQFSQCIGELKKCVRDLQTPTPNIILCGDLNLPNVNWMEGECIVGASRVREEQKMVSSLYDFATDNFLVQHVEESTHQDGNTLDLIFTNNPDIVHSYYSIPTKCSIRSFYA